MAQLANQQSALLQALWQPAASAIKTISPFSNGDPAAGIGIYKANAEALAQRALLAAYPVLDKLLGEESFYALAQAFWAAHPPVRGDITQWGADLPTFIAASEQLRPEPYLPDVARAEWHLHALATAADANVDMASLGLLMTTEPTALVLHLAPGTALLVSRHPIVSILSAHRDGLVTLEEAGLRLCEGRAESAVIWREGYKPCVREAHAGEVDFLNAVLKAESLALALDAAPALDFAAWLGPAVQSGLLISATSTT
jgi:Putative DNA-binding domain